MSRPLLSALLLCWMPRLAAAKCDTDKLLEGQRNLASVDVALHTRLAAQTLVRACAWPAPVQTALQEIQSARPDQLMALDRKLGSTAADLWKSACPGGLSTLQGALAQPWPDAHARVWEECQFSRFNLSTAAEFSAAPGSLTLPVVVAWSLSQDNVDPGLVRDLTRALAGLAPPWASAP